LKGMEKGIMIFGIHPLPTLGFQWTAKSNLGIRPMRF